MTVAMYLLMSEDEQVQGAVRLLTERMGRRKGVLGKAKEVAERYGLDAHCPGEVSVGVQKGCLAELGKAQKEALVARLKGKVYHGTHVREKGIDRKATHAWVKEGKLTPKSESVIMAAQDGILLTREFRARH